MYIHLCLHIFQYLHIHTFVVFFFFHGHLLPSHSRSWYDNEWGYSNRASESIRIQQEMGISRLKHQLKNPKMEIFLFFFSASKSLGFSATFHHPKKKGFPGTTHLKLSRKTGDIMGRNQGII